MSRPNDEVFKALRARARRSIQCVFAALSLASVSFALYLHHSGGLAGLTDSNMVDLKNAFLFLGTGHALTMWLWDWLFWDDLNT